MRRFLIVMLFILFAVPTSAQTINSTLDTANHWHSQWDIGTRIFVNGKEARLNFHRSVVMPSYVGYTQRTIEAFGLLTTDKVMVFGAGFGALEETMEVEFGFAEVISVDPSLWIQAAKATTEDADLDSQCVFLELNNLSQECRDLKDQLGDGGLRTRVSILDENLADTASRNTVRQAFSGGGPDYVITDFIFPYVTNEEAQAISARLNQVSANVLHTVNQNLDGRTLDDWKALLPDDIFYDISTREVR